MTWLLVRQRSEHLAVVSLRLEKELKGVFLLVWPKHFRVTVQEEHNIRIGD